MTAVIGLVFGRGDDGRGGASPGSTAFVVGREAGGAVGAACAALGFCGVVAALGEPDEVACAFGVAAAGV
jgi:hypothetical protein